MYTIIYTLQKVKKAVKMLKKVFNIFLITILISFVTVLNGCFSVMGGEDSEYDANDYFSGFKTIYKTNDIDFTEYVRESYTIMATEILIRLTADYGYGLENNTAESGVFYIGGVNNGIGVGKAIAVSLPFSISIEDTHKNAIRSENFDFAYTNTPADIDDSSFDINLYLFNDGISVDTSYSYLRIYDSMFNPLSTINGYNMSTSKGYLDGVQTGYNTNYIQVLTLKILGLLTQTEVNEFDTALNVNAKIYELATEMDHIGLVGDEVAYVKQMILNDVLGADILLVDNALMESGTFYGYEFDDANDNSIWDATETTMNMHEFITGTSISDYETGKLSYNENGEPLYDNTGIYLGLYSIRQTDFKNYENTVSAIVNYIAYGKEDGLKRYPQITDLAIREFTINDIVNPASENATYAINMIEQEYQSVIFMVKPGKTINVKAISMFLNSIQSGTDELSLQISLRYQHNGQITMYTADDLYTLDSSTDEEWAVIDNNSKSDGEELAIFNGQEFFTLGEFDNIAMETLLTAESIYTGTNRSDFEFKIYEYETLTAHFAPYTSLISGQTKYYYYDTACDFLEIVFENVSETSNTGTFKIGLPGLMFED